VGDNIASDVRCSGTRGIGALGSILIKQCPVLVHLVTRRRLSVGSRVFRHAPNPSSPMTATQPVPYEYTHHLTYNDNRQSVAQLL
jgi:hypothetical protein